MASKRRLWCDNKGVYWSRSLYGVRESRTIFPGIYLKYEGSLIRNGLNIFGDWDRSRGFILRLGRNLQYYFRYSVSQRRFIHGWERRNGD